MRKEPVPVPRGRRATEKLYGDVRIRDQASVEISGVRVQDIGTRFAANDSDVMRWSAPSRG